MKQYHHGDLPNALRRAAANVIAEEGLGSFSLREVARRANVSHTAPAHHFGDMTGLLTSLAAEGFDALHRAQIEAIDPGANAAQRLVAIARAYVELAEMHPGYCEVMFRVDVVNADDPEFLAAGLRAHGVLVRTIEELIAEEGLTVKVEDVTAMCWCLMQGLVVLRPKLELVDNLYGCPAVSTSERISSFVDIVLNGLRTQATCDPSTT